MDDSWLVEDMEIRQLDKDLLIIGYPAGGKRLFTGIVEELGIILGRHHYKNSIALLLKGNKVMDDLQEGDSIAVNGVCLTVARRSAVDFYADVMPETLRKTNSSRA